MAALTLRLPDDLHALILEVQDLMGMDTDRAQANARLIAVAPKLAEFVRTIVGWWLAGGGTIPLRPDAHIFADDRTVLDHARALLAQIDGR